MVERNERKDEQPLYVTTSNKQTQFTDKPRFNFKLQIAILSWTNSQSSKDEMNIFVKTTGIGHRFAEKIIANEAWR